VDGGYSDADEPSGQPYFMLISIIEPCKNHFLVLNIRRELAADARVAVPRLILVGAGGWEHEQVADMLDRCEAIRAYVFHAARLSSAGIPSGIEGFLNYSQRPATTARGGSNARGWESHDPFADGEKFTLSLATRGYCMIGSAMLRSWCRAFAERDRPA
jgi:hypothetical protein